jgi:peptidoglycan/xylan/chitin deacetylase (PgdA/CDA1 family)
VIQKFFLKFLQTVSKDNRILPFYHIVTDDRPSHIIHLYDPPNIQKFVDDLDFVGRHFAFVDVDQINRPSSKPIAHLSFDDGLIECHDIIAPILQQKGIPATFFVNNDYIDNHNLFFRYKASILVGHTREKKWLSIGYNQRHMLDQAAVHLGIDWNTYLERTTIYMTSDMIRSLISQGFTIGSHSNSHPLYNTLSLEAQIHETITSVEDLKSRFEIKRTLMAFPFTDDGVGMDYFDALRSKYPDMLSFGTAGKKLDTAPSHLQRIPMETTLDYGYKNITRAYLKSIARSLIFVDTVVRR